MWKSFNEFWSQSVSWVRQNVARTPLGRTVHCYNVITSRCGAANDDRLTSRSVNKNEFIDVNALLSSLHTLMGVVIISSLLFVSACTGVGGMGGNGITSPDGIKQKEDGAPAKTEPGALPPVSIPAPSLKGPNSAMIVAYNIDSQSSAPIAGSLNALDSGYVGNNSIQMVVTHEPLDAKMAAVRMGLDNTPQLAYRLTGSGSLEAKPRQYTLGQSLTAFVMNSPLTLVSSAQASSIGTNVTRQGAMDPTVDVTNLFGGDSNQQTIPGDIEGMIDPSATPTGANILLRADIADMIDNVCDIHQESGFFECYGDSKRKENEEFFLTVINKDNGEYSESVAFTPNKNVLWLREDPKDITAGMPSVTPNTIISGTDTDIYNGVTYTLTKDISVAIKEKNGNFEVQGTPEENYKKFETPNAQKLIFNPSDGRLGYLTDKVNIIKTKFSSVNRAITAGPIQTTEGAEGSVHVDNAMPTIAKVQNGFIKFGVKFNTPKADGLIFKINDAALVNDRPEPEQIYTNNTELSFISTIAFDKDADEGMLSVYESTHGIRFRYSLDAGQSILRPNRECEANIQTNSSYDLYGFRKNTFDDSGIEEIITPGAALAVDTKNQALYLATYDTWGESAAPCTFTPLSDYDSGIKKPVALALNSAKTRAYVLNQGDKTITTLDLTTDVPKAIAQYDIRESLFKGKQAKLDLASIVFQHSGTANKDYVLVTVEGIRAALTINVDDLTLSPATSGQLSSAMAD